MDACVKNFVKQLTDFINFMEDHEEIFYVSLELAQQLQEDLQTHCD